MLVSKNTPAEHKRLALIYTFEILEAPADEAIYRE